MAEGSNQDVEAVLDAVIVSEPARLSDNSVAEGEARRLRGFYTRVAAPSGLRQGVDGDQRRGLGLGSRRRGRGGTGGSLRVLRR